MRTYITNLNGHSITSTAQIAQNMVTDIAVSLGFRELGIHSYPIGTDSPEEMSKRLDGICSGLRKNDIVIFQTPTWNTTTFDEKLFHKLKIFGVKIVIFIHDVVPLMFDGNFYLMDRTIAYYNEADVLVAPSQAMVDKLQSYGLTVKKILVQGMWDHPTNITLQAVNHKKLVHFPGNPERFNFIKNWRTPTELHVYTDHNMQLPTTVVKEPYQSLYCPYKLGAYIAAGIPVIIQKGIANQDIIEKNNLGFIIEKIDDISNIVESTTEEEYMEIVSDVRRFNPLVRQGYFTRKLLTDAVFSALNSM
ncbi:nucleotide sugar synthetase-like protein [Streptococcus agalactiae]|uniref:nucleotide sugar synthetase-like protein n=1 Tax=Streptococcus agalactiae TaxID=1311 RepID=UPI002EBB7DA4|nr:nucleotide sugar synthetase-like protein [Streptococcus agalactiae]